MTGDARRVSGAASATSRVRPLLRADVAQHAPGMDAGVLAVAHQDLPVDQRGGVPRRRLMEVRGARGQLVAYFRQAKVESIEIDDVEIRERPAPQDAAIRNAPCAGITRP